MTLRRPLLAKYAILITALAGVALLASGAIEIYFSHRLHRATLAEVQRDKAAAAASSVSRYIEDLAHHIGWATVPASGAAASELERRRLDYLKLLRLAPAITTLRFIDRRGLERIQVSRLDADRTDSKIDLSGDPGFIAAHDGQIHFSPIYFFEQTEPYISIAVPDTSGDGSVTLAEVNLKFIWAVVTEIKVGEHGYAYVVDARGRLVAHRDIHRVLQMTDLSALPQVRAAFALRDGDGASREPVENAVDPEGRPVLSAYAAIQPLRWIVLVEQPRLEALAPLHASLSRTAVVILIVLGLALLASLILARGMVAPIRKLQAGAQKIGAGDLGHRIHVDTGDELQELAEQFNRMGAQLQGSYADLERRIAERTRDLEAANQAKSRFLAAASHDLHQPIHALSLLLGQLRCAGGTENQNIILTDIEAGVAALGNLLDDLLDISKLEAGAIVAHPEDFAVAAVFDVIDNQFAPAAREKGLKFKVRRADARVHSDPVLLQRVLLNFVSNAVRYTARGGVLVGCRRRGHDLQIAVWDTGCGIPSQHREEIFREFVQLESPGRDRGKGLGLGLAIVARLAPLLGSCVELKSAPGRGSMFAVRVPLADSPNDSKGAAARAHAEPAHDALLQGVFALIVDDDEAARERLKELLDGWGCLTIAACDASDALALVAQHDRAPDLVICDYYLGSGENGIEALGRIQAASEHPLPSILLTADRSPEVLRIARHHQYPMLLKPAAPAKLRALVSQLLLKGRRRRAQESYQETV